MVMRFVGDQGSFEGCVKVHNNNVRASTCALDHFHLVSLHSNLCKGAKIVDMLGRNLL